MVENDLPGPALLSGWRIQHQFGELQEDELRGRVVLGGGANLIVEQISIGVNVPKEASKGTNVRSVGG